MVDPPTRLTIMLVAGEPSGDELGARLMEALRDEAGDVIEFFGVGGPKMEKAGLKSVFPMAELTVMGLVEVLPRARSLLRRLREIADVARSRSPDAIVTIDAPGFNFRLARRLAGTGIPMIHYVAPSVWAWRPGRAKNMARSYDHVMALLPFEPPYFLDAGLDCTFVGHPVIESGAGTGNGRDFRRRLGIPFTATALAVLPGSRQSEVGRLLPIFADALKQLQRRFPDLHLLMPTAPTVAETVAAATKEWPHTVHLLHDSRDKFDAFAASDAALAASGTVALELSLAQVPAVITYRVSPISAFFARRLLNIRWFNLVNILTGRMVVPELIQDQCRPFLIANTLDQILTDPAARDQQIEAAKLVREMLTNSGVAPALRAAQTVLKVLADKQREASNL